MPRTLKDLSAETREKIIQEIHSEAEAAGWSTLSNQQKGALYRDWEQRYDLTHATIKDSIMKGFDVQQGIPKSGEGKIQEELIILFRENGVDVKAPYSVWTGKERIDMVLGYSGNFPTHVVEVERADTWAEGLRQALWYRAAFWQKEQKQVLPTLILFGNASQDRFKQITDTCDDNRIALLTYEFQVNGQKEEKHEITRYLNKLAQNSS